MTRQRLWQARVIVGNRRLAVAESHRASSNSKVTEGRRFRSYTTVLRGLKWEECNDKVIYWPMQVEPAEY